MASLYFFFALCCLLGAIFALKRFAPRGTWRVMLVGPTIVLLVVIMLFLLANEFGIGFHVGDVKAGA